MFRIIASGFKHTDLELDIIEPTDPFAFESNMPMPTLQIRDVSRYPAIP